MLVVRLQPQPHDSAAMKIEEIAELHDAAILTDRDGDIALLARHYNDEGIQEVRYAPDPCDYLPEKRWEAMAPDQVAARIC